MSQHGFIIGSVDAKTGKDFSISKTPTIHLTQALAMSESKRLLTEGKIAKDRKLVILTIKSYVSINQDPFVIE